MCSAGPVAVATMLIQLSLADQSTSGGFSVLGAAAVLFSIMKAAVGALAVYAVPPEAAAAVLFPTQVAEDWVLSIILLKVTPWSVQYFLILLVTLAWDVQRDATLLKALLGMVRRRWCREPAAVCHRPLNMVMGEAEQSPQQRLAEQTHDGTAGVQNIVTEVVAPVALVGARLSEAPAKAKPAKSPGSASQTEARRRAKPVADASPSQVRSGLC
eukprot:gene40570-45533_t